MLKSASCTECSASLPLVGELRSFRLPPVEISCPGCKRAIPTTLPYRATWMERLVWKVLTIIGVPLAVVYALMRPHGWLELGLIAAAGVFGPFVVSRMVAFPITLLVDRLRR